MSLRAIHLRKLLKILYSRPNTRVAAIRADIRGEIAKEQGAAVAGGDFYGPFWADAKSHALGVADLRDLTIERVASNRARENLYPRLEEGFLLWWNERRRWTNAPFRPVESPKARFRLLDDNAYVKIENFLALKDSRSQSHYIYPYFVPDPPLQDESARVGLWMIGRAFPSLNWEEVRILDVMRGQTFAVDRNPLQGNEEAVFLRRYRLLLEQSDTLRSEYLTGSDD